jgi:phosphatidylethanolamine-binding protein (PEBP) family uncharacterized protein
MTIIGRLLRNRRAGETHLAWNLPNLRGAEVLALTSQDFGDGEAIPLDNAARRVGGKNLSPDLTWSPPPPGTAELLLVVEDIDAPMPKPFVHCVALIDPARTGASPNHLEPGALSAEAHAAGVRVLLSGMGRGYLGPEPIKGHGPHRYLFQLFALAASVPGTSHGTGLDQAKPRAVLSSVPGPVIARGRLTGVYER